MKYERSAAFKRDYKALPNEHGEQFRAAALQFRDAAEQAAAGKSRPWPNGLRIKPVAGTPGVWEMTWSKDHPDGRATWEWTRIGKEPAIRWRRIGNHSIFTAP